MWDCRRGTAKHHSLCPCRHDHHRRRSCRQCGQLTTPTVRSPARPRPPSRVPIPHAGPRPRHPAAATTAASASVAAFSCSRTIWRRRHFPVYEPCWPAGTAGDLCVNICREPFVCAATCAPGRRADGAAARWRDSGEADRGTRRQPPTGRCPDNALHCFPTSASDVARARVLFFQGRVHLISRRRKHPDQDACARCLRLF